MASKIGYPGPMMTVTKINKIFKSLSKETKQLYHEVHEKVDTKYKLGVNGIGVVVFSDLNEMVDLAKGEKECQKAMKKLLEGAK